MVLLSFCKFVIKICLSRARYWDEKRHKFAKFDMIIIIALNVYFSGISDDFFIAGPIRAPPNLAQETGVLFESDKTLASCIKM